MYSSMLQLNVCEALGSIHSTRPKTVKYKEGHL